MPVTEFALFTLRDGYDAVELLELVMECEEVQNDWVRANHPNDCAKTATVSRTYIDETDTPHRLAITAPWQSPQAHQAWIDTLENKAILGRFAAFFPDGTIPDAPDVTRGTADGADSAAAATEAAADHARRGFTFFHMHAAGACSCLHEAFSPEDKLAVTRLAAHGAGGRDQLQARYRELEEALLAESPKQRVWAGWRIEKDAGQEELVVFRHADVSQDLLSPLHRYGTPIGRELKISDIAP